MAPKDIRSFFAVTSAPKKKVEAAANQAVDPPGTKKAKLSAASGGSGRTPDAASPPAKASNSKSASGIGGKGKASAAGKAASGGRKSSSATPQKAPAGGAVKRKRKPAILDNSDGEEEWSGAGEDMSEADESVEINLVSDSEDEQPPAKRKAAAKLKATANATPSKAASKRASAADAKAARPKMEFTPHLPAAKTAVAEAKSAAVEAKPAASPTGKGTPGKGRALPKSFAQPAAAAPAADKAEPTSPAEKAPRKTPAKPRAKSGKSKDPLEGYGDDVRAAVAAVDEAEAKLPPQEELGITTMEASEGGFGGSKPPDDPPNAGGKEPARGHPECLLNRTFVVTGVLDSLKRDEADDLIKRHGGRVTGSVSGKTTYLLAGTQCGRSKIAQAKDKGTRVINEDGLFALINATSTMRAAPAQPAEPSVPLPPVVRASAPAAMAAKPLTVAGSSLSKPGPQSAPAATGDTVENQLWVEKHKPQRSMELVGNATLIHTLRQWLFEWHAVHIQGQAPSEAKGRKKDTSKKAVLISGTPGIGKSSSALIICRELGLEVIEVNASDTRNKADGQATVKAGIAGKLANSIKELTTNTAIGMGSDGRPKRTVLVMDEVDGMSAGDRGGVADLIQTIHKSKIPIIAICNDKYNQKLKSLRNHCMELEYRKPTAQQIGARMMAIAKQEGLQLTDATMRSLVEGANGDLRLILGQLQMIRLRTTALSYDDAKKHGGNSKDEIMSPFEAARKLLDTGSRDMRLGDQIDLVFQDMDLVPLLIQENYLNHKPAQAGSEVQQMQLLAKAADSLSLGDGATRRVRMQQNWALMPFACVIGSVCPAAYMRGPRFAFGLHPGEMNFPRFSAWFGANSTSGKQRRLLGELHTRMTASSNFHSDRSTLRLQYTPALRRTLVKPLETELEAGIPAVIQDMHEYCMSRDDLDFVLDVTKFKTQGTWNEDPMKNVPTALKSAFTRAFNKDKVAPRTNIMSEPFQRLAGKKKIPVGGKSGGRRRAAGGGGEGALRESEEEAAEQAAAAQVDEEGAEEEASDVEQDPEALQQRLAGGGLNFSAKAGASGGAKRGSGRGRVSGGRASGSGSGRGSGRGRGRK
mmetsp:Transcript_687/g.1994  ORF Transcript_687/g.1994 Transcript_687/m.1994 type:complete len:1093 (+) Transcript_687:367-3645(+)